MGKNKKNTSKDEKASNYGTYQNDDAVKQPAIDLSKIPRSKLCEFQFVIHNIWYVDCLHHHFKAQFSLKYRWMLTNAQCKRYNEDPDSFHFHLTEIPRFNFCNMGSVDVENKTEIDYLECNEPGFEGRIIAFQELDMMCEFGEHFEVSSFPFDVQGIHIFIAMQTDFILAPFSHSDIVTALSVKHLDLEHWEVVGFATHFDDHVTLAGLDEFDDEQGKTKLLKRRSHVLPTCVIQVKLAREYASFLSTTLSVFSLLTFLCTFVWVHPIADYMGYRVGFTMTCFLTVVAFFAAMGDSVPESSSYTFSDVHVISSILYCWLNTVLQAVFALDFADETMTSINRYCVIATSAIWVIYHVIMYIWAKQLIAREKKKIEEPLHAFEQFDEAHAWKCYGSKEDVMLGKSLKGVEKILGEKLTNDLE